MHSFIPSLSIVISSLAWVKAAPSVTIPAGSIQGTTCSNGASAFLAVPFAEPPVGDLRWASPQAYNQSFPSEGYNATTPGKLCIQFGGAEFVESGESFEDCLYLNVWAPKNATKSSNLPVKIWIHGGGEQGGGIQNPIYDGCNLAAQDTVLVSLSYRLGPLGFLTLSSAGIDGNFGVQDILLGLDWVQSHISAFGGDKKKVLLFGQSAGALNTFIISTLPKASSLINSAIWESGYGPQLATPAVVNTIGAKYATSLNCSSTDVACLRSVSTKDLQAAASIAADDIIYTSLNPASLGFQPYVDGSTIPAQPWSVGPKVPIIFGSNANEGNIFTLGTFLSPIVSPANYSKFLSENFGPAASAVEKEYPLSLPAFNASGIPGFEAISTIITQAQFHCPIYQALLKAEENNIPVYTYLNSHIPTCPWALNISPQLIPLVQTTHTAEIPLVFGNGKGLPQPGGNCSFDADENAISATLIAAWTAMASTGNPSVDGGLQWPQWTKAASKGLNIVNSTSVGSIDFSQCALWDPIYSSFLNFTTASSVNSSSGSGSGSSSNGTSGNSSSEHPKGSGAEKGAGFEVWGVTLAFGIVLSILIG